MKIKMLHHVSIVTSDLDRSSKFYREVLGLPPLPRPPFATAGAWFALGTDEVHILANSGGTFSRKSVIDRDDSHFAIRVESFDQAVSDLAAKGFREDAAQDDPMRLLVSRDGHYTLQ